MKLDIEYDHGHSEQNSSLCYTTTIINLLPPTNLKDTVDSKLNIDTTRKLPCLLAN